MVLYIFFAENTILYAVVTVIGLSVIIVSGICVKRNQGCLEKEISFSRYI